MADECITVRVGNGKHKHIERSGVLRKLPPTALVRTNAIAREYARFESEQVINYQRASM